MGVGLVVRDGQKVRQLRRGAPDNYNPRRRAVLYKVGQRLVQEPGPYREMFMNRKKWELFLDPDATPIKLHRRAKRYVEKRLLRNLWREWRRATTITEG